MKLTKEELLQAVDEGRVTYHCHSIDGSFVSPIDIRDIFIKRVEMDEELVEKIDIRRLFLDFKRSHD